ncbi:MAG: hypothetical protein IKB67_03470 [Clostridia bacterium]|nr:hypothetical protein [Clostridia bacterium]
MQEKELENLLQEKADKVEMREFSQVWNEIKGQIEEPKPQRKFVWKRWAPAFASAFLVLCIALSPIIINSLKPAPEVFYSDDLSKQIVSESEMFDGLAQANISHVDLSEYSCINTFLYYTEDMSVKGASVSFYNNICAGIIKLYDVSVDLSLNLESLYDSSYKVSSTNVLYKFKQESGGLYEYSVYALHNKVQYVIEYTGLSDNLVDFLNEFFG